MGDIAFPNFALDPSVANNSFAAVWKATRAIKKAGATYLGSSDGTSKDTTGVAANDLWGGNADPAADAYPTTLNGVSAWWACRGPSTLKLAMTTAPTGSFQRGEPVTQATTGATGEFLGYVFSATTGSGWAVIMPRTGAFDGSHVITGAASGASFAPTALQTFYREIVFWKASNATDGSIYYVAADASAESASLFSTLMTQTSCTPTVAPGGSNAAAGGNANNFPAIALVIRGTAAVSAGAAASHTNWMSQASQFGNAQAVAFNQAPSAGITADGTFWCSVSNTGTTGTSCGFGLFRCDDQEPGDIDPFAWKSNQSQQSTSGGGTPSRTSSTGFFSTPYWSAGNFENNAGAVWRGYCARGVTGNQAAKDVFTTFYAAALSAGNGGVPALVQNASDVMRVANHPDVTPPVVQEPVRLFSDWTSRKMYKGRVRRMGWFPIGAGFDSFDSKSWMVLIAQNTTTAPALALRYDGATTPSP